MNNTFATFDYEQARREYDESPPDDQYKIAGKPWPEWMKQVNDLMEESTDPDRADKTLNTLGALVAHIAIEKLLLPPLHAIPGVGDPILGAFVVGYRAGQEGWLELERQNP